MHLIVLLYTILIVIKNCNFPMHSVNKSWFYRDCKQAKMNSHSHAAGPGSPSSREKISLQRMGKLKIVLVLSSAYFAAAILGGLLTHSLALIA
jgi:hypothetical protein